jgi:hypothetical protein
MEWNVQEKIPLACIGKCPFVIRVIFQRKQGAEEWYVTGKAAKLGAYYQNSRMIGLDIGITSKGQLYIIEANLKPGIGIFKKFLDKKILRNFRDFRK